MSSSSALPADAAQSTASARIVIRKPETALLVKLLCDYRNKVDEGISPPMPEEASSLEGTSSLSLAIPARAQLTMTLQGAFDYILPRFIQENNTDEVRARWLCSLPRIKGLLASPPPPPPGEVSAVPAGALVAALDSEASLTAPVPLLSARSARLQKVALEIEKAAKEWAASKEETSRLSNVLSVFSNRSLSLIRESESAGVLAEYGRAESIAIKLQSLSTTSATAVVLPLLSIMRLACEKAINCGWEWAISKESDDSEKAKMPFDTVLTSPDTPAASLQKRSLEFDSSSEEKTASSLSRYHQATEKRIG